MKNQFDERIRAAEKALAVARIKAIVATTNGAYKQAQIEIKAAQIALTQLENEKAQAERA